MRSIGCASAWLRHSTIGGIALVFASATHVAIALAAQSASDLPAGIGAEVARNACLSCHEADLIRQQRLTRGGWDRELDKMVRWGATVTDLERDALIDYLAGRFRPTSQAMPR